jgi:hypothetical protein
MEQHLESAPPLEPLPSGAPLPLQKYTPDGWRLGGSFILWMIDSVTQMMTGVTHVDPAENSVTRGQGDNLGDSNSDLWWWSKAAPLAPSSVLFNESPDCVISPGSWHWQMIHLNTKSTVPGIIPPMMMLQDALGCTIRIHMGCHGMSCLWTMISRPWQSLM